MKIGLFGGSFDPIHRGHVEPVQRAVGQLGLERVLYLPTAVPPHKRGREFAPALARYAMTELALLDEARLEVSAHELTLGRPAYTADTVEHFAARMPGAALHLLLGADSFRDFGTWVRWLDMLRHVRLVVLARPGTTLGEAIPALPPQLQALAERGEIDWVTDRLVALSSTEIRDAVRSSGEPPAGALAPPVVQYIRKYGLYR